MGRRPIIQSGDLPLIIKRYRGGETGESIARTYGVTAEAIYQHLRIAIPGEIRKRGQAPRPCHKPPVHKPLRPAVHKRRLALIQAAHQYNTPREVLVGKYLRQRGRCGLCGCRIRWGANLDVDRDHATGALRDLLCNKCHVYVGAHSRVKQCREYLARFT